MRAFLAGHQMAPLRHYLPFADELWPWRCIGAKEHEDFGHGSESSRQNRRKQSLEIKFDRNN
jgi:hypothetical protein